MDEVNFLEHILVGQETNSIHKKSIFVPCVYFYSTKVMIIPFHCFDFQYPNVRNTSTEIRNMMDNAKPFLLQSKCIVGDSSNLYADCSENEINFITMIELHPERCLDFMFNELIHSRKNNFIST